MYMGTWIKPLGENVREFERPRRHRAARHVEVLKGLGVQLEIGEGGALGLLTDAKDLK